MQTFGSPDTVRANRCFFGNEHFLALRDDPTEGQGLTALLLAYDDWRLGNELYEWSGKHDPLKGDTRPFTIISCNEALPGKHLLPLYQKIIWARPPVADYKDMVDTAYSQLQEERYEAEHERLSHGSDWDRNVTLPALELQQGQRRSAYVSIVEQWLTYTRQIEWFRTQLREFLADRREQSNASNDLAGLNDEFMRMAARYNTLAAVALEKSATSVLDAWRSSQDKHTARAEAIRSKLPAYCGQLGDDLRLQLHSMQKALISYSNDPAVKEAESMLEAAFSYKPCDPGLPQRD
jgi:hypothetical protein